VRVELKTISIAPVAHNRFTTSRTTFSGQSDLGWHCVMPGNRIFD